MERGRLVKEQSWVPGMGVAFCECCQLYGARCGLESPCSWGRPDDLCCLPLFDMTLFTFFIELPPDDFF